MALATTVMLAGCGHHRTAPAARPGSQTEPSPQPLALSQRNLGFTVLAEVENARAAIRLHDAIAAGNDVGQALAFANQMIDYRPQSPAVLTSFSVRVSLFSAQARLTSGEIPEADALLSTIQDEVPHHLLPPDLPLLRAAAALDQARTAALTGGIARLRTQLLCAQGALDTYDAPGHIAEVKQLAATLQETLAKPQVLRALLPYQISLWLGDVTTWAGSYRWQ